ncbi:MAG: S1 family peptidase [Thermoguttaceae bacterium]
MSQRKISLTRLGLAFVVGLIIAIGIKFLVYGIRLPARLQQPAAPAALRLEGKTQEIEVLSALGVERDQLDAFLRDSASPEGGQGYPLLATFQNAKGDYLADSAVKVAWADGEEILPIGNSGVLSVSLVPSKLAGMKFVVPEGYSVVRQQTIPMGSAYQAMQKPDTSKLSYGVVWDREIQDTLRRELYRLQLVGSTPRGEVLREQLRRSTTDLQLAGAGSGELTPADIYRLRKSSVVVVACLLPGGRIAKGAGVVVDAAGVVATAFHVVNKPEAAALLVMTASGETYPITEVLAARRSADVALVKTTGENLAAAPLSEGDPEGTAVTLISHPAERFYTLTQGYISRYSASVLFGETIVRMAITADFADGSSGGPVFNARGEVAGLVSFTSGPGGQMVHHFATPVAEIRGLLKGADAVPIEAPEAAPTGRVQDK